MASNLPRTGQHLSLPAIAQAGVIPYRSGKDGQLQVLLIRRRHKRRWGIPKGIIEEDQTTREAALQEAREEAGIGGELSGKSVGHFEYRKWNRICRVEVFLLHVKQEDEHYDEESFRERRWFNLKDAAKCKIRSGIPPLLEKLPRLLGGKS